jgi:hypothetical protein
MKSNKIYKLAKYSSLIAAIISLPIILYNYFFIETPLDPYVNSFIAIIIFIQIFALILFGFQKKEKIFAYFMILSLIISVHNQFIGIYLIKTISNNYATTLFVFSFIVSILFYSFLIYISKKYKTLRFIGIMGLISIILTILSPEINIKNTFASSGLFNSILFLMKEILSITISVFYFLFFSVLFKEKKSR